MPTVLEILQKTTEFLARKEIASPKLEAELLLSRTLDLRKLDLYLRFDQQLTETQLTPMREQVARRGKREPLQYIAGRTGFLDFEVACDRRALIPRPETEELAENIFDRISTPPATVLDLGTGTGVLALAMARRWPECQVTAVDASEDALALARANAAALGLTERIRFLPARWPEVFSAGLGKFDIIVSNPPYLTDEEWTTSAPEVREWEPKAALVAADGGLADLRTIIQSAPTVLSAGGLLALETGVDHAAALAQIALSTQADGSPAYAHTESIKDLSRRERFFLAWRT
ncbi:MAG TPA: peptide chain release factor N(5)-glutamine methyltransferase [Opitutales bacterium]|nr:peptide chain release factor N(5)-glutamine methyltransferase [Opitutales bacterium]